MDDAILAIKKMTDEKLADFSNFEKMTIMQSIGDIYARYYSAENMVLTHKTFLNNMFPKK